MEGGTPAGGTLELRAGRGAGAAGAGSGQPGCRDAGRAREGWARRGDSWCHGLRNSGREWGEAGLLWETPQLARSQSVAL